MEHLKTAALDVTLLVTTVRALDAVDADEAQDQRKARKRWAGELKRAVAGYLAALWRSDDARFDVSALNRCRVAAEREMKHALRDRTRIKAILEQQPQGLAGYVTARNDLWRLAHVIVHLRAARLLLERRGFEAVAASPRSPGRRLQRRLRRAMSDYARSLMRSAGPGLATMAGRQSAVGRLDARSFESADKVLQAAADVEAARRLVDDGVVRPMRAIVEDWTTSRRAADEPAP
jgi:hypothetical protein